jgi:hypothetical protein
MTMMRIIIITIIQRKINLFICLIKRHALEDVWDGDITLCILIDVVYVGEWSASRPGSSIPREEPVDLTEIHCILSLGVG